jgi:hypothetical protein
MRGDRNTVYLGCQGNRSAPFRLDSADARGISAIRSAAEQAYSPGSAVSSLTGF